jgi:hypothetical protein
MGAKRHYFSSYKTMVSPKKGVIEPVGGVLVFEAGLGVSAWLKKNRKSSFFIHFFENIFSSNFLVIGVKPGKSSGMGEEI